MAGSPNTAALTRAHSARRSLASASKNHRVAVRHLGVCLLSRWLVPSSSGRLPCFCPRAALALASATQHPEVSSWMWQKHMCPHVLVCHANTPRLAIQASNRFGVKAFFVLLVTQLANIRSGLIENRATAETFLVMV